MATAYEVIQQAYKELGNDSQKYWDWYFQDNKPYCENTIFSRQACFVSWLLTKCAVVCPNFPRASIEKIDNHTERVFSPDNISVGDIIVTCPNETGIVTAFDDDEVWIIAPWFFDNGVVTEIIMPLSQIKYCFRPYYRNKV